MPNDTLREPERQVPVHGRYEVVVIGGGPAGILAAAAAGRCGRKTLLIERYGFLGGMGTAAGVTNFCGLFANVHGEIERVVHGLADDFLDRIDHLGGLNTPHVVLGKTKAQAYDTAAYKRAADTFLQANGVEVLFHGMVTDVVLNDGVIEALLVATKSGRRAVTGAVFIDCSGDGDVAAWSGVPFALGDGAGEMLFPSTMFRVNGVDPAAAGEAWETIPRLMDEAERLGTYRFPRHGVIVRPQKHPTEWRVNVTQIRNARGTAASGVDADELSAAEFEGRQQVFAFFEFLKNEVPGFSESYIVDIAPQIGIRETRRIEGLYQLTGSDVLTCADFPDTIGVNGWPLEKHVAGTVEWGWPPIPESRGFNHLPYRMLLPRGVKNLLVAGRCASMDHDGHSAARVSGACFVMGQAAGTAAHRALANGVAPGEIDVGGLQEHLERDGVFLGRDKA